MPMEEKKLEGISPYRMNQIVKTASVITEQLVNGRHLFQPTYHECGKARMNIGGSKDVKEK